MSVVVAMGKFTQVQTEYAIKENLPRNVSRITAHIVVGTPGTMTDLIRRKVIDVSEVKLFVLDEADNMLDQDGLGDQTLRVRKCVLCAKQNSPMLTILPQHASAHTPGPDYPVLRYVPRSCADVRQQIRTKRKQDRASERGTLRRWYPAILHGLPK